MTWLTVPPRNYIHYWVKLFLYSYTILPSPKPTSPCKTLISKKKNNPLQISIGQICCPFFQWLLCSLPDIAITPSPFPMDEPTRVVPPVSRRRPCSAPGRHQGLTSGPMAGEASPLGIRRYVYICFMSFRGWIDVPQPG